MTLVESHNTAFFLPLRLVCALIALCVLVLSPCLTLQAHADSQGQVSDLAPGEVPGLPDKNSSLDYGGDVVAFFAPDLTTRFDALISVDDEVELSWDGGKIELSWTHRGPVACEGFYLNALADDESTWLKGNYFPAAIDGENYAYDVTLSDDYCGRAWPIVPIRAGKPDGASDVSGVKAQYHLAVPPLEKYPVEYARAVIAALPSNPRDLLRDTGNEAVAKAAAAYLALSDDQKAKVSDDELMHLAKCAIAVLPSDPFKVSAEHAAAIGTAEALVAVLSDAQREELDSEDNAKAISSSRSYGRYLENAAWALDALKAADNATSLVDGTYTAQVSSTSSMGKSNSPRSIKFTVRSVMVKDGRVTAVLEHGSNSSQTLKMGGVEYPNLQTDPAEKSYYEVPVNLNSTFHFSVKGKDATDDTDAITYEMTVTADEGSMTPDVAGEKNDGPSGGKSGDNQDGSPPSGAASSDSSPKGPSLGKSGSTANLNSLVKSGASGSKSGSSPSAAPPDSSGAASPADETRSKGSAGSGGSSASVHSANVLSAAEEDAAPVARAVSRDDLSPAIAGGALLFASGGALAFTLRFLRRENAIAQGGAHD